VLSVLKKLGRTSSVLETKRSGAITAAPASIDYICLTFPLVTPLKPFHPTGSIYHPPLPGEGRMTLTA
jgi:hypothetical protein